MHRSILLALAAAPAWGALTFVTSPVISGLPGSTIVGVHVHVQRQQQLPDQPGGVLLAHLHGGHSRRGNV